MSKINFLKASIAVNFFSKLIPKGAVPKALDIVAHRILKSAKSKCPVHTGALRASGRVKRTNQHQRIVQFGGAGSGVDYAALVEFGGGHRGPTPFLEPAVIKHRKDLESLINTKGQRVMVMMAKAGSSR